ncbi:hypothetical protein KAR91_78335 [Candidatus Pacearchaeota archaeon]|nr:hypothetical protein [Candidatus Pacearchaeota archaeon]
MGNFNFMEAAVKEFNRQYMVEIESAGYLLKTDFYWPVTIYDAHDNTVSKKPHIHAVIQSEGFIPEATELNTKGILPESFEHDGEKLPVQVEYSPIAEFA